MMSGLSRRAFIISGGAAVAAALGGCVSARDTPLSVADAATLRLQSVKVNTAPLQVRGLVPWANLVEVSMQPELNRLFASRLAPHDRKGDRLVVQINSISLNAWAGSSWINSAGSNSDYMDGSAIIIGPDGAERARYYILLALPASSAGAWYLPDIDNRRVIELSRTFAKWVHDKVLGR